MEKLFVDRLAYLDRLEKSIKDDDIRLILIIGQGGIGKTAIIAKFCNDIENEGFKLVSDDGWQMPIRAIIYINKK